MIPQKAISPPNHRCTINSVYKIPPSTLKRNHKEGKNKGQLSESNIEPSANKLIPNLDRISKHNKSSYSLSKQLFTNPLLFSSSSADTIPDLPIV